MSLPSSEAVPPVSDATPPVPPASPPQPPEESSQKRPLLRSSSMIDVNSAKEEQEVEVEQSAKRARDISFKPASEEGKRANIREILTNIALLHKLLASRVKSELCPEKDGEFVREVEFTFSLSFSETFCAIAKSK